MRFGALVSGMREDIIAWRHVGDLRFRDAVSVAWNPSLRVPSLMRLAASSPRGLSWFWRRRLLKSYGCDVGRGASIGAPLLLPHPLGIVIGAGAVLEGGVTLYQGATLGLRQGGYPMVQTGAVIYPHAVAVGPVSIGRDAIVGANRYLDHDLPASAQFFVETG